MKRSKWIFLFVLLISSAGTAQAQWADSEITIDWSVVDHGKDVRWGLTEQWTTFDRKNFQWHTTIHLGKNQILIPYRLWVVGSVIIGPVLLVTLFVKRANRKSTD